MIPPVSRLSRWAPLLAMALAACGDPGAGRPANQTEQVSSNAGYVAPPSLTSAARLASGVVQLKGTVSPGAQIRLASPDGAAFGATAGEDGAWTLDLPASSEPRMFSVAAQAGPATLRGEGALIVLPAPGPPALLARAGFAAVPLSQGSGATEIVALDYDSGGGAAIAGLAAPDAEVRLTMDNEPAGIGQADAAGRFAILAPNRRLSSGTHTLAVEVQSGNASARASVQPPIDLTAPFRAARQPGAWRMDWALPGGGVQTTLVFDAAAPAAPPEPAPATPPTATR